MRRWMIRFVIYAVFLAVLPFEGFDWAYRTTRVYFEKKLIALPFEPFGRAAGTVVFCGVLGIGFLVMGILSRKKEKSL